MNFKNYNVSSYKIIGGGLPDNLSETSPMPVGQAITSETSPMPVEEVATPKLSFDIKKATYEDISKTYCDDLFYSCRDNNNDFIDSKESLIANNWKEKPSWNDKTCGEESCGCYRCKKVIEYAQQNNLIKENMRGYEIRDAVIEHLKLQPPQTGGKINLTKQQGKQLIKQLEGRTGASTKIIMNGGSAKILGLKNNNLIIQTNSNIIRVPVTNVTLNSKNLPF